MKLIKAAIVAILSLFAVSAVTVPTTMAQDGAAKKAAAKKAPAKAKKVKAKKASAPKAKQGALGQALGSLQVPRRIHVPGQEVRQVLRRPQQAGLIPGRASPDEQNGLTLPRDALHRAVFLLY